VVLRCAYFAIFAVMVTFIFLFLGELYFPPPFIPSNTKQPTRISPAVCFMNIGFRRATPPSGLAVPTSFLAFFLDRDLIDGLEQGKASLPFVCFS